MEGLQVGLVAIACCILAFSLAGNIALTVVILEQLPRQAVKNYSYLILNLAVSDLLFALSSIPFDIVERFKQPVFPFGSTMCKVLWPFQTVCGMASIFTVGALSYQRYRLIVRPCKGKLPLKKFMVLLTSIWVLPVLLAGIPYSSVLHMDSNTSACIEEWTPLTKQAKLKLSFTTYLFIIQYILPLALIVWCNVRAIGRLKRYLKYRRRTSILCALPMENHENAIKMLTIIVAVFAFFWLPGQVMSILLEFELENSFFVNYGLNIAYLFAFANCVANPLIFACFSKEHKRILLVRRLMSIVTGNPTSVYEVPDSPRDVSLSGKRVTWRGDLESGSETMKNFLEMIRTTKVEKLKKYLDSTPETVLH